MNDFADAIKAGCCACSGERQRPEPQDDPGQPPCDCSQRAPLSDQSLTEIHHVIGAMRAIEEFTDMLTEEERMLEHVDGWHLGDLFRVMGDALERAMDRRAVCIHATKGGGT